jgi:hypothetical protein
MTAQNLIYSAFRVIGHTRAGQTNGPESLADGLVALNGLIDSATINRGFVFTERLDTWTLTIGKQTYTIGVDPAGMLTPDLVAARPVKLTRANLLLSSASNTVRRKINLLTDAEWRSKAVQNIPGMPIDLYNDGSDPLSTYWFYMTPDQAYVIETYSWQQLIGLATLASLIVVPPGYYEFYLYSLAARLASMFGKELPSATMALLSQARYDVMALNAISPRIRSDSDMGGHGSALYNWIAGEDEPY